MPRFLPDTNCVVAALLAWHEHHERAVREIERRLDAGEDGKSVLPLARRYVVSRLSSANDTAARLSSLR
jgi:hypothetical protein